MESWNLRGSPRRLQVPVLIGFPGSGKTTDLDYLTQQPALIRTMGQLAEAAAG